MRIESRRRVPGSVEFGVIYGLMALVALILARFSVLPALVPACAFKTLFGLPCPTCGATRSILLLSRAEFLPALAMNPLLTVIVFVLAFVMLYSLVTLLFRLPRIRLILSEKEMDMLRIAVILVVLLNWLYLYFAH